LGADDENFPGWRPLADVARSRQGSDRYTVFAPVSPIAWPSVDGFTVRELFVLAAARPGFDGNAVGGQLAPVACSRQGVDANHTVFVVFFACTWPTKSSASISCEMLLRSSSNASISVGLYKIKTNFENREIINKFTNRILYWYVFNNTKFVVEMPNQNSKNAVWSTRSRIEVCWLPDRFQVDETHYYYIEFYRPSYRKDAYNNYYWSLINTYANFETLSQPGRIVVTLTNLI